MRKLMLTFTAAAMLCGCSWLGLGDDSSTTAVADTPAPAAEETAAAPAETPAQTTSKAASTAKTTAKKATSAKGKKSEAQIKAELDQMGHKLAAQSARTLLPNKANKEVKNVGGKWVATYIEVDPNRVSTEMRPGANGQYVGFVRYQERIMECTGSTRAEALKAPCTQVRTRNLNELIRYDGHAWQD